MSSLSETSDYKTNEEKEFNRNNNNDDSDNISDFQSYIDPTTFYEDNNPIRPTETAKSLHSHGLESDIPPPDINHPPVENPIFPEEYQLETETGLVKVETLTSLGRQKSNRNLDPEIELVTFLPNDPENPFSWSMSIRCVYTFILSMLVISAAYGSSSLAGGLPVIDEKFHVSTVVSTLSVSLMVIGFSVGPLIWAPMSEQYGRKITYIISYGLYTIINIPCALTPNIGGLLVSRFLCGCFSSSALTIVGASICDLHDTTRGMAIAIFSFCPYSGPVLGGVVNGFISVDTGRYDLMVWVNMAFAGVMWIAIFFVPETYAPVILKNKAKRLRKETGNNKIMTEQEATPMSVSQIINDVFYRPLKFVVQEPVLDLICAFIAMIYALLYAFFFAYPVVFRTLYGYKDDKIGLMYIPILIGALIALLITPMLESQYGKMIRRRTPVPEDRLIGAMIGSPFPAISLFIFGATLFDHIIWVGPASSGLAFGFGMVLLYYSLNNYLLDSYHKYAASALGTKVFIRSTGGAVFPLFITQMYEGMGFQWASWLLAFVCVVMAFIPFAFYKFGGKLRAKLCREDYSANLKMVVD